MRVLAIPGSLRDGSYNVSLARAAVELAPAGVDVEVYDGLGKLPLYDDDLDGEDAPVAVRQLREQIAAADALFFATPEYNGSISGVLKNAIDWASRPRDTAALRNKPVAVVGASTGMFGAVWAQAELRKVLASAGARVLDGELPVPAAHTRFDEQGRLADEELRSRLAEAVQSLAASPVREPVAA